MLAHSQEDLELSRSQAEMLGKRVVQQRKEIEDMEEVLKLSVPLMVEIHRGVNWAEAK